MRALIQLAALFRELDPEAAPVNRMVHAFDQTLLFELVDNAGHGAQPDVEVRGQFAHGSWTMKIENPKAVRLGYRQRSVEPVIQTPELVQLGQIVQGLVEL